MSKIITLSEAASIGMHAMVLIARADGNMNVNKIADMTGASRNHLAKVMQRMVKDKYVKSTRGPTGGFKLIKPANKITILNIYESIEGKIEESACPLERPICPFNNCMMGSVIFDLTKQFKDYLTEHKLSDYL
jgi:Rrf2 family protein